MSLIPHTITALQLNNADSVSSDKNVIIGAVVTAIDGNSDTVILHDDENYANGTTSKVTGPLGSVTVYIEAGDYIFSVNGTTTSVSVGTSTPVEFPNFSAAASSKLTKTGQRAIITGAANAPFILMPDGYTAKAGDLILSNFRVLALQISGHVELAWFGAAQDAEELLDSATDDLDACNLAALRMQQEGGGIIKLSGLCALSGTLAIPQRVIFEGSNRFFTNQFTNNEVRPSGCGFYALPATNAKIIDLKLDIYNDAGTLRETVNNKKLLDYRHFGGLRNIIIYGNRSDTANPPGIIDKNTTGSGVTLSGIRYPILYNVVSMMCAGDGFEMVSFNYGIGSNSCNNIIVDSLTALSNAENGFSLGCGDSILTNLNAGYNGVNGVGSTMGASTAKGMAWNNQQDGLSVSGGDRSIYDFNCYDQKRQGFRIANTVGCTVRGIANANGRDTGLGLSQRVGVLTADSNELLRIDIVSNGDKDGTGYQSYGFNISNATNPICVAGCFAGNNFTGDWLVTTPANIIKDTNAP